MWHPILLQAPIPAEVRELAALVGDASWGCGKVRHPGPQRVAASMKNTLFRICYESCSQPCHAIGPLMQGLTDVSFGLSPWLHSMITMQAGTSLENHRCCCGNLGPPTPCLRRRPWAHLRTCRDAGRMWQQSTPTCASGAPSGTLARSSDDLSISNGESHPDALVLRDRLAARRFRDGPAADRISQTVQAQDALFEAANLTSCFKALAKESAEQPDGSSNCHSGMPAAQQTEFLDELCEQVQACLLAFRPAQLVGILWACGRWPSHISQPG